MPVSERLCCVIFLSLPGGDLCNYTMDEESGFERFNEPFAKGVFRQIVLDMSRIHSLGWAHKDVSLENTMYDPDSNVATIIDFGMVVSAMRDPASGAFHPISGGRKCGKKLYIAPEMQDPPLPPLDYRRCDIWSLGIMLFILLAGAPPMETSTIADDRFRIIAVERGLQGLLQQWGFPVSAPATDLLQSILVEDPAQRPTAAMILAHPWLN
jgi:calcium-dependent protein kinase